MELHSCHAQVVNLGALPRRDLRSNCREGWLLKHPCSLLTDERYFFRVVYPVAVVDTPYLRAQEFAVLMICGAAEYLTG